MNKKLALSTAISALLYSALAPANVTFNLPDGHTFTVKSATSGNVVLRVSPSGELLVNGQPLTEIVGKEGPQGEPGIPGRTILSGATGPKSSDGIKGDFWLDTELSILYGPKTDAGWGSGVSIVGADGPQGPKGDAGARGATGPAGPQGDKGDTGVAGTSCTVEQVESSAVITCEDGTSAALASAGTVVTYPEGLLGEVPPTNVPTGTIVLVDGGDTILGIVTDIANFSNETHRRSTGKRNLHLHDMREENSHRK